jgi:hypothetical protein
VVLQDAINASVKIAVMKQDILWIWCFMSVSRGFSAYQWFCIGDLI